MAAVRLLVINRSWCSTLREQEVMAAHREAAMHVTVGVRLDFERICRVERLHEAKSGRGLMPFPTTGAVDICTCAK